MLQSPSGRMGGNQPDKLRPGIPAGPQNGDLFGHGLPLTTSGFTYKCTFFKEAKAYETRYKRTPCTKPAQAARRCSRRRNCRARRTTLGSPVVRNCFRARTQHLRPPRQVIGKALGHQIGLRINLHIARQAHPEKCFASRGNGCTPRSRPRARASCVCSASTWLCTSASARIMSPPRWHPPPRCRLCASTVHADRAKGQFPLKGPAATVVVWRNSATCLTCTSRGGSCRPTRAP